MKTKIYLTDSQDKVEVTPALKNLLRSAIRAALRYEKFPQDAEISLTLVDNEEIHRLNMEFRQVDRATDVLSFPQLEREEILALYGAPDEAEEEEEEEILPEDGAVILGDIVVSLEKATEQASEYGHSFEREAAFLCVHSVLHLLGYDHEQGEEEEKDMFDRQEKILVGMKLVR